MKGLLPIILCSAFFLISKNVFSQKDSLQWDTTKVYRSIEEAMKEPDKVYQLDLSKKKLTELPQEVYQLKNLRYLSIRKNKIKSLPYDLKKLVYLEVLIAEKNKFTSFPPVITELSNLKRLNLGYNNITSIPSSINQLEKIEYMNLWYNNLAEFPNQISELKNLKLLDLRAITYSKNQKENIEKLLPNTEILFSPTCNCKG